MTTRRTFLNQAALATCALALPLPAEPSIAPTITGSQSLKAQAHKRGLLAGCAVGAANLHEPDFTQVLIDQYSLVVPENAMKFGPLRPSPTEYNFADADALVDFARQHNIKVRGHNFVWHEQLPTWFATTVTKENAKQILTTHIQTVASRYKGKIQSWDVVNEAINPPDGRTDNLRNSPWLQLIGPEYLELAFRTARQADPHAKLTYNEYGIENEGEADQTKRAATLDLLKRLKAANVPIHALGIQSHISAGNGQIWGKGLRDLIAGAEALGLDVYLTELDVNDDAVPGAPDSAADIAARDQQVANVYRDYLTVALENKAVKSVLTWGLTDKHSWLNGMKSHREKLPNRPQRPLPFDPDYKPATAFFALRDALAHAPHR